jgi:serine/threonine protein kinase
MNVMTDNTSLFGPFLEGHDSAGLTPVQSVPNQTPMAHSDALPEGYVDLGPLGQGGLATVRRVFDGRLKRVVAMKILRPEFAYDADIIARFVAEAQATAQLAHPGIIAVFETGQLPDGRPYFTMREVRGQTMHRAIQAIPRSKRRIEDLLDAFLRVVEAVAYAHSRGVVHRDLKPSNIMLGEYGDVLVVDWGIAKLMGHIREQSTRLIQTTHVEETTVGLVMGSPRTMAPEQASGDNQHVGPAADVYALGTMLFHILTGTAAFNGDTAPDIIRRVLTAAREPFEATWPVPSHLRRICDRAMQFEQADRYPDAGAMMDALTRTRRGVDVVIRLGLQTDKGSRHLTLPVGAGLTVGELRKYAGEPIRPDLSAEAVLFEVAQSQVRVFVPVGESGSVVTCGSLASQAIPNGYTGWLDPGTRGSLDVGAVRLLFEVGALRFD